MEEQVLLLALEQPPSLPALTAAVSRHSLPPPLSCGSEGPGPSLRGCSGLVHGAERCHTTPRCPGRTAGAPLGYLPSRDTVLWLPRSTAVYQQEEAPRSGSHPEAAAPREGSEGSLSHHGHAGAGRALAPRPAAGRLTDVPCSSRAPAASSSYGHRAWATSRGPLGGHQTAARGCTRACSGSPGCSPGKARSRENGVQSWVPHQSRSANCPQPTLHASSQHRATEKPRSERTWGAPWDEPHHPDHHKQGRGLRQGSGKGLLPLRPPPRARKVSTLATLDKESPCLGPFPKSTGKLTASQGCNGHLGKLIIQSVSQGCA